METIFIGQEIRRMRESLGMTQAQLARRAGMSQSTIAGIETGKRRDLQLSTIMRLAEGLDASPMIGLQPKNDIRETLEKRSLEVARKIVLATSGSAAIEMQLPDPQFVQDQIKETQKEILKKHKSLLWERPSESKLQKTARRSRLHSIEKRKKSSV